MININKIFNRKTLKICYSCTKHIFEIINNHNKEMIKEFHDRTNNNNNNNNNNKHKLLWDFNIQTDHLIPAR